MISLFLINGCGQTGTAPVNAQETLKPLNIEGTLFAYSVEGEGIPCIVLSGSENLGSKFYSPKLKKHLKLIHADPVGITKEELATLTLEKMVEDFEKVRKFLGIKKIAIMGHSMFSIMPLEYAIRKPDHVSFAITSGGVPSFSVESTRASNRYWDTEASDKRKAARKRNYDNLKKLDLKKLTPLEVFIAYYNADIPLRFYNPEYDMTKIWEGERANMDFIGHYWKIVYGYDNTDKYPQIKAPVLIISGRYDFGSPYFLYDGVKDQIPDFKFVLFEKAGHNPMLEVPEKFDKTIINWLQK